MIVRVPASPKKLVIAEKPSVARDLAKALGGFKANKAGFLEREDMLISSAVGHLAERGCRKVGALLHGASGKGNVDFRKNGLIHAFRKSMESTRLFFRTRY